MFRARKIDSGGNKTGRRIIVRDWSTDYGVGDGEASDSVELEEDAGDSEAAGVASFFGVASDLVEEDEEVELFLAAGDEVAAALELFFAVEDEDVVAPVFFVVVVPPVVVFFVAVLEVPVPPVVVSFLCAAHETQRAKAAEPAMKVRKNFFIVVLVNGARLSGRAQNRKQLIKTLSRPKRIV